MRLLAVVALVALLGSCPTNVEMGRATLLRNEMLQAWQAQAVEDLPEGYRGLTFCREGHVEVWQRRNAPDDGMGKARDEAVLRHEMKHAEQFQARGCAVMDSLRHIPDSVLAFEAEAMCVEMVYLMTQHDQDPRELIGVYVIQAMRESGVRDVPAVVRAFRRFCPEMAPP